MVLQRESVLPGLLSCRSEQLVVLDEQLGGPEILHLCRAVRQTAEVRPWLLVLTAPLDLGWRQRLLTAGADDTLTKPFEPEELRARLGVGRRILRQRAPFQLRGALDRPAGVA
jgi:DNA-binding response OmpR family regulator